MLMKFISDPQFLGRLVKIILAIIVGFFVVLSFVTIPTVPFHPDESTYIYMSADFERLFTDPLSMIWRPGQELNPNQKYRELDAPLVRYFIGIGRWLLNEKPLQVDWNWSETWEENQSRGALPDARLLFASRITIALLFPASIYLVYKIGSALKDQWVGMISATMYAINALILLHTRRAMSEGILLFGLCLALWSMTRSRTRPWLVAVCAAFAFNAKYSAAPILVIGLLAAIWCGPRSVKNIVKRSLVYISIVIAITFILNPFLWSNPVKAALAAFEARQAMVVNQAKTFDLIAPEKVLQTPSLRLLAMVAHTFITPPAYQDVGNYQAELAAQIAAYQAIPGVSLFRGIGAGAIMLTLSLIGTALLIWIKPDVGPNNIQVRGFFLPSRIFLLSLTAQAGALLITVPLPFQRYWLPLLPFVCVLVGYTLVSIGTNLKLKTSPKV